MEDLDAKARGYGLGFRVQGRNLGHGEIRCASERALKRVLQKFRGVGVDTGHRGYRRSRTDCSPEVD